MRTMLLCSDHGWSRRRERSLLIGRSAALMHGPPHDLLRLDGLVEDEVGAGLDPSDKPH